jgi:putative membrane protein
MHDTRFTSLAVAALCAGLAAPQVFAQTAGQSNAAGNRLPAASAADAAPVDDRGFVAKAAVGGLAEVQLGELAQRNGASTQVKQFGAQMVRDHGKANDELKGIAAPKGIQPPAQLDAKHAELSARLQKLSGAEFDREYVRAMLDAHKTDVALFERQAANGRDADLKAFAQKTLPTLRQHLEHVQGLSTSLGGSRP